MFGLFGLFELVLRPILLLIDRDMLLSGLVDQLRWIGNALFLVFEPGPLGPETEP